MADDYTSNLLNKAQEEYPFIAQHDPIIVKGDTGEDYAETWPPYEEGADNDRPQEFPIDRTGIVIGKPDEFDHHDLAGEILHVDPMSHATREQLMKSWTPKQLTELEKQSKDWKATLDEGRPVEHAIRNATDAAIRGYILNQWPNDANQRLNYRPEQIEKLENLKTYMKSEPSNMKKGGLVIKPIKGGSKLI
jgi:hypothetical protein